MTEEQEAEIKELIELSLDKAENIWDNIKPLLEEAEKRALFAANAAVDTLIPGYPSIKEGEPHLDRFLAMALDMRDSSKHLMCHIAGAKVTMLQRIFYETSALLPVAARLVGYESGAVTEFLGDGLLAVFRVDDEDKTKTIYAAHRAAKGCMRAVECYVNSALDRRYSLPPLKIGIGLSISQAVVTLVGDPEAPHPKAFGQCVFHATKLSNGVNEICVDEALKMAWPTAKGGKLSFESRHYGNVKGYMLHSNE